VRFGSDNQRGDLFQGGRQIRNLDTPQLGITAIRTHRQEDTVASVFNGPEREDELQGATPWLARSHWSF
jgi:hypothetical protein